MRTLQLAGDSLEGLLEQVRREYGEQARIVEANKCRVGGIAGFFARESFEVTVELDDDVAGSGPGAGATGDFEPVAAAAHPRPHVTSVLELADAINEIERATSPIAAASTETTIPTVAPTAGTTGHTAGDAAADSSVSTETDAFASLLERLARDVDPFDAEGLLVAPAATPAADGSVAYLTTGRPSALRLREDAGFDDGEFEPDALAAVTPTPAVRPAPATPAPAAAPLSTTPVAGSRAAARDLVPALAQLGLPAGLCGPPGERDIRLVLAERLRTLPTAPPLPHATGAVLAVAGDAERALGLARDLALELDLDPGDVLLATPDNIHGLVPAWLHLGDRDTAGERRRSWWRRDRLTLVAVDAGFGMPTGWSRRMLDALEPNLTWGVVDATWKPEDVERWSDGLGGVDSLAVQNLRATVSPAAILNADVPVARLDGATATPTVWSSLLAERLAA